MKRIIRSTWTTESSTPGMYNSLKTSTSVGRALLKCYTTPRLAASADAATSWRSPTEMGPGSFALAFYGVNESRFFQMVREQRRSDSERRSVRSRSGSDKRTEEGNEGRCCHTGAPPRPRTRAHAYVSTWATASVGLWKRGNNSAGVVRRGLAPIAA